MRKSILAVFVVGLITASAAAPAQADVIWTSSGTQEIGGEEPTVAGTTNIAGFGSLVVNPATGGSNSPDNDPSDFSFTWSGYDQIDLGSSTLTYTRHSDSSNYFRGTLTFNLGGADLVGSGVIKTSTVLFRTGNTQYKANENISIQGAGDITLAGIDTSQYFTSAGSSNRSNSGSVTLGASGAEVGNVQIGYINSSTGDGTVNNGGYGGTTGAVTINSDGYVWIGDGSSVRGDIIAYNAMNSTSGDVSVTHVGDFWAGSINTNLSGGGNGARAGNITLNGTDSSGDLDLTSLSATRHQVTSSSTYVNTGARQVITIRNYDNVLISGSIDTSTRNGETSTLRRLAGNVTISDITGDITIGGPINLQAEYFNGTTNDSGSLALAADGTVTLAELDLGKVQYASLSSGTGATFAGENFIVGELAGFDTNSILGAGSLADPYLTTQDALRTPDGQVIFYDPAEAGNAYLGGFTYRIADLSGSASAGGYLTPFVPVPEPATVALLAMGGLACGGAARRRRTGRQ